MIAGCADRYDKQAEIEKTVHVSGTLTFNGTPLESFQVSFIPTDGRRPATGVTDKEGKFTLGTNKPGDGAPPGNCRVAVVYSPPETEASDSGNAIDDPSKMPKPAVNIPAKYSDPETSGLKQDVPKGGVTDLKINLE